MEKKDFVDLQKRAASTRGDVVVDALHRDGGVGDGVALQVTHKALDAAVNL